MNPKKRDIYIPYDEIDFEKIRNEFGKMILFKNVFLNMQGMNVYITDPIITKWEYQLLEEYIEMEKTPIENALTLSAFSQMWIFQLYELLRTIRQKTNRIKAIITDDLEIKIGNTLAENVEYHIITECRKSSETFEKILDQWKKLEPAFKATEAMRMNLAKHEVPKREKMFPPAPGYGRINMVCGSIDFQLIDKNKNMYYQNRRNIADMLRLINVNA